MHLTACVCMTYDRSVYMTYDRSVHLIMFEIYERTETETAAESATRDAAQRDVKRTHNPARVNLPDNRTQDKRTTCGVSARTRCRTRRGQRSKISGATISKWVVQYKTPEGMFKYFRRFELKRVGTQHEFLQRIAVFVAKQSFVGVEQNHWPVSWSRFPVRGI